MAIRAHMYKPQILHFILLLTTLIVNVLLAHSIPLLITHCCLAFAFLVYIPTAFILSAMRSTNRFDQAGGEVAYLVVQQAGWLGEFTLSMLSSSSFILMRSQRTSEQESQL